MGARVLPSFVFILTILTTIYRCQEIYVTTAAEPTDSSENHMFDNSSIDENNKTTIGQFINETNENVTDSVLVNGTTIITKADQINGSYVTTKSLPKIVPAETTTNYIINVTKSLPGEDWSNNSKKVPVSWMDDYYMKSLMLPITCGVGGALLIVCLITSIKCLRRRKIRKVRVQRKVLPMNKNIKPTDRVMLLGESSDEEF